MPGRRTTRRSILFSVLVSTVILWSTVPVHAAPDKTVALTDVIQTATWPGSTMTGANQSFDSDTGEGTCPDAPATPEEQCEQVLLHVTFTTAQTVQVRIHDYSVPGSDFDMFVYQSDATGARGAYVDFSAELPGSDEVVVIPDAGPDEYFLILVVPFAVAASDYTGTAEVVPGHPASPPDIDTPPGLQDFLASDPALGFRSHSEPHIDQNPLDPNMLIAGSKQYNRDPDSLDEYEFKNGTYVSFDAGQTWTDLGQLRTCPLSESPPTVWGTPAQTCYPAEDPNEEGTGEEDDPPGSDIAEEYITSDPWVQFDDEGNAYIMLLDSPPFEGTTAGWGMSVHIWESVSQADLLPGGTTWGPRIAINQYDDPADLTKGLFLDDKNTIAVNNAGDNRDGEVGPMIACWGRSLDPAPQQQIVCKTSLDGGRTWIPPSPATTPIPDAQPLVIGVHAIPDPLNEMGFHALWLQYTTDVAAGEGTIMYSYTADAGASWTPSVVAAGPFTTLPTNYPGQRFRNLTIPIGATAPDGTLYVTYADYNAATDPSTDFDDMEADIKMIKASPVGPGGPVGPFSAPMTVNGGDGNADQFQPVLSVTPSGQVNVSYFDRRFDPSNYFVDTVLSRSNNGGASFSDVRVSHDLTDPEHNAPTDSAGNAFFGDYQGLVSTNCRAIPFVNDTHLANDPDSGFDPGYPRSEFQEVVSWVVPNTNAFGGPAPGLPAGCAPPPPLNLCPGFAGLSGHHIVGGPGNDVLVGTSGRDIICGQGGNDILRGFGGNDVLLGGDGSDAMRGDRGRDLILGQGGNDVIRGDRSNDLLAGGDGNDVVRGGRGRDRVSGNRGDDVLYGGRAGDSLRGGKGRDRCRGGPGEDLRRSC